MAGVVSRAAGRLRSAAQPPTFWVTTVRRPALFPAGPRAPAVPRLIHTAPSREEIREMLKEAVKAEVNQGGVCLDRYERLSTRLTKAEEVSATRHAECMAASVKAEQRIATISFRIGVTMIGLAAASQYQGEIGKIFTSIFGVPPSPPSPQQVAATVKEEVKSATSEIPNLIKVECAHHFLEEERKKELRKEK